MKFGWFWVVLLCGLLSACASLSNSNKILTDEPLSRPVIEAFQGRLLVMEPARRWQVMIYWQANLQQGYTRLVHAASGRVVELKWQDHHIQMRDNQQQLPIWRQIGLETLMQHGIILEPWTLAEILHQKMPSSLHKRDGEMWQGVLHGNVIQLRWQHGGHKLTMTDMTHGRTAILQMQR